MGRVSDSGRSREGGEIEETIASRYRIRATERGERMEGYRRVKLLYV